MPERLDDTVRERIAQAIRTGKAAGTASCRGIATEFGVSPGTVRNIARDAGIVDPFARTKTANATRARVTDMAARRAALAEALLTKAEHILKRLDQPYVMLVPSGEGVFERELAEPPLKEVKDGMAAVVAAAKAHTDLIKFDTKEVANPAASSLVDRLADLLQLDQGNDELVDDGYPTPLAEPQPEDDEDDDGYVAPSMDETS